MLLSCLYFDAVSMQTVPSHGAVTDELETVWKEQ
jgi:hypothetical protein